MVDVGYGLPMSPGSRYPSPPLACDKAIRYTGKIARVYVCVRNAVYCFDLTIDIRLCQKGANFESSV